MDVVEESCYALLHPTFLTHARRLFSIAFRRARTAYAVTGKFFKKMTFIKSYSLYESVTFVMDSIKGSKSLLHFSQLFLACDAQGFFVISNVFFYLFSPENFESGSSHAYLMNRRNHLGISQKITLVTS